MPLKAHLTALILAILPGAAMAQDAATCKAMWGVAEAREEIGDQRRSARLIGDWCVVDRLDIDGSSRGPSAKIRQLSWRGTGLSAAVANLSGPLPLDLTIKATGLRLVPDARARSAGPSSTGFTRLSDMDVALQLGRKDGEAGLQINGPIIDFQGENSLNVVTYLGGIDASTTGSLLTSLPTATLGSITVELASDGAAAEQVLAIIGAFDPNAARPWTRARRDEVGAILDDLPDAMINAASRAALRQVLADMPRLRGQLTLAVTPTDSFALTRLLALGGPMRPETVEGYARLLAGLTLSVIYSPDR